MITVCVIVAARSLSAVRERILLAPSMRMPAKSSDAMYATGSTQLPSARWNRSKMFRNALQKGMSVHDTSSLNFSNDAHPA